MVTAYCHVFCNFNGYYNNSNIFNGVMGNIRKIILEGGAKMNELAREIKARIEELNNIDWRGCDGRKIVFAEDFDKRIADLNAELEKLTKEE